MIETAARRLSTVLDPTGASPGIADSTLAPRTGTLRGQVVGLLDNGKVNGGVLLEELGRHLDASHHIAGTKAFAKPYAGQPLPDEQLERIAGECDVVITAIGDCGSCSAATLADGILLERHGRPAVSIVSKAFELTATAIGQAYGFPGYRFATTAHPVASLTRDDIRGRIPDLTDQVLFILGVG